MPLPRGKIILPDPDGGNENTREPLVLKPGYHRPEEVRDEAVEEVVEERAGVSEPAPDVEADVAEQAKTEPSTEPRPETPSGADVATEPPADVAPGGFRLELPEDAVLAAGGDLPLRSSEPTAREEAREEIGEAVESSGRPAASRDPGAPAEEPAEKSASPAKAKPKPKAKPEAPGPPPPAPGEPAEPKPGLVDKLRGAVDRALHPGRIEKEAKDEVQKRLDSYLGPKRHVRKRP